MREALALFRANGAPSWMSDQKLAQGTLPPYPLLLEAVPVSPGDHANLCSAELGLHIPRSLSSRPSRSPEDDDSPPLADDVLDKKAVDVRFHRPCRPVPALLFDLLCDNLTGHDCSCLSLQCGLSERKFTFSANRPRGFGIYD